jgi:hypothetical protein
MDPNIEIFQETPQSNTIHIDPLSKNEINQEDTPDIIDSSQYRVLIQFCRNMNINIIQQISLLNELLSNLEITNVNIRPTPEGMVVAVYDDEDYQKLLKTKNENFTVSEFSGKSRMTIEEIINSTQHNSDPIPVEILEYFKTYCDDIVDDIVD